MQAISRFGVSPAGLWRLSLVRQPLVVVFALGLVFLLSSMTGGPLSGVLQSGTTCATVNRLDVVDVVPSAGPVPVRYPVGGATVRVLAGPTFGTVRETSFSAADGSYCITTAVAGDVVEFELTEQADRFRVGFENTGAADADHFDPAFIRLPVEAGDVTLKAFDVEVGTDGQSTVNGSVRSPQAKRPSGPVLFFGDAALVYIRSQQFLDWWADDPRFVPTGEEKRFSTPLTARRVDIVLDGDDTATQYNFTPEDEAAAGYDVRVFVDGDDSDSVSRRFFGRAVGPENVEWHELVHYLAFVDGIRDHGRQTEAEGSYENHAGWPNHSSADSLEEGLASFMAAVAGRTGTFPELLPDDNYASFGSLESNLTKAWSAKVDDAGLGSGETEEDLAVAALLWDLWDGTDDAGGDGLSDCPNPGDVTDPVNVGCDRINWRVRTTPAGFDDMVSYEDIVTLPLPVIYDALKTIPRGSDGDFTVAGFRDRLHAHPDVPSAVKSTTVDVKGAAIALLDIPFLMHGFHPCDYDDDNPNCAFVTSDADEIGQTDHVEALVGLTDRRALPTTPGAALRLENPDDAIREIAFEIAEEGVENVFSVLVGPGEVVDLPLHLPSSFSFPLPVGATAPGCDALDGGGAPLNDANSVVTLTDALTGALTFDSCHDANAIRLVGGAPAVRYVVGEDAIRFLVALADSADPDAISVHDGFTSLMDALEAAGIGVDAGPAGTTVGAPSIDHVVELAIPGLEHLAGQIMPGVGVKVWPEEHKISLDGAIEIGSEVLDITIVLDWEGIGDLVPAIDVSLDLIGAGGETLITAREAAELVAELVPDLVIDPSGVPDTMALESFGLDLSYDDGLVTVDAEAFATLGDVRVGVLVAGDNVGPEGTQRDPVLVFGIRFDNATDPAAETITLDGLLEGDLGELAAGLELPEFSMVFALPAPVNMTESDLRQRARDFFDGELPVGFQLESKLSLAADLDLDSLGSDVRDLFGYATGDSVKLAGELGFTLTELHDGGIGLEHVKLTAQLPPVSGQDSSLLPDWFDIPSPGVTMSLGWAADPGTLVTDVSAPVAVDVGGDTVLALLSGRLELSAGRLQTTLEASLTDDWHSPFDQDWLSIESDATVPTAFSLVFTVDESDPTDPADDVVQLAMTLSGTAGLGPEANTGDPLLLFGVILDLVLDDNLSGVVTFRLLDEVSMASVATVFGIDLVALDAPVQLRELKLQPGTSLRAAASPAGFELDAVINIEFPFFGTDPEMFSILMRAGFPATGAPSVLVGVRPESTITLGDIVPIELPVVDPDGPPADPTDPGTNQPPLALDFTLVDPGKSDFGFVFAVNPADGPLPLGIEDGLPGALPPDTKAWFEPLFGGRLAGETLDDGFSALGSFTLPEPLDEIVQSFGFEDNVLAAGRLPIPGQDGLSLDLDLRLQVDDALLDQIDFIDSVDLTFGLQAEVEEGARLQVNMGVAGRLRFLQGVDPELVSSLKPIGLDFSTLAAAEVSSSTTCPRGGTNAEGPDGKRYCYDLIDVDVDGFLAFSPPTISVGLEGGINPVIPPAMATDPQAGWAPLGLEDVVIRSLNGRLELGFNPANQPTPVSIKVGAEANMTILGKNAAGAIQAGADVGVTTAGPVPVPTIKPNFDGFRLALPSGVSKSELVAVYQGLAGALGMPENKDLSTELDKLPDIAIRDLQFAVAIGSVDRLCIQPGLVLTGTLYVYSAETPTNSAFPPCDPAEGTVDFAEVSCSNPEPGGTLHEDGAPVTRRDQGCLASVEFFLDATGLLARGTLTAMDLDPLPVAFTEDIEVELVLRLTEQRIKMVGGVLVGSRGIDLTGPIDDEWASGRMALMMRPDRMEFVGQLDVFGMNALVDGELVLLPEELFDLFTGVAGPELNLHVTLAGPTLDAPRYTGDPDFADIVLQLVAPTLEQMERIVTLLDAVLSDFSADPARTLAALPQRLTAAGYGHLMPTWVTKLSTEWSDFLGDAAEYDLSGFSNSELLDVVLNGFDIPGIPGKYFPAERTCRNLLTATFTEGTVLAGPDAKMNTADDTCWSVVVLGKGIVAGLWVDPVCTGVVVGGSCWLLPPLEIAGACSVVFPTDQFPSGPSADGDCTLLEVREQVQTLFDGVLAQVAGLTGTGELDDVFDTIRNWLDGSSGPLFALECAEFDVNVSAFGESSAALALDATVFGAPLQFAQDWTFDPGDLLGTTMQTSAGDTIAAFWDLLVDSLAGVPSTTACVGASDEYFGPDGISFDVLPPITSDDPDAPVPPAPPPPPPVVSLIVSPTSISEHGTVTATIAFDRVLTADDGARDLTIMWGDGDHVVVSIPVGEQTVDVDHQYADDDPSGTSSDVYAVTVDDPLDPGLGDDQATVTVRNVAPVVTLKLDDSTIDEHGVTTLTVGWTDTGLADNHEVTVDWGDGTTSGPVSAASGKQFAHQYLDDDPTDTSDDDYAIRVTVSDDDRGVGRASTTVNVSNVAPGAEGVVLSPTTVDEGELVEFTVDFTDAGTLDTHTVEVEFLDDHDGTFEPNVVQATKRGSRSADVSFVFVDDDPTATPQDEVTARIRVTDDDGGMSEVTRTITVRNVAPTVCATVDPDGFDEGGAIGDGDPPPTCPPPVPLQIDEGDTANLSVVFTDPGVLDTHVVVIDWGDPALPDTIYGGRYGLPLPSDRQFTVDRTYGDNGTFAVAVTVTDDDAGVGAEDVEVHVANVDPTATVDEPVATMDGDGGTVLADGPDDDGVLATPTFLGRAGTSHPFKGRSTDPGSDDLTFTWGWDASGRYDTTQTSWTSLLSPGTPDPVLSPSVDPRDVTHELAHTWTQPCLYGVGLTVTDDDLGSAQDGTWVVVTGTDHRLRRPGYWYNEYDLSKRKPSSLSMETLGCHLETTQHMSRVFSAFRSIDTFDAARDVLNTKRTSDEKEIMVRQLLATWLNFANGSVRWFDMVDTDGDRAVDTPLHTVLTTAEALRMDPSSTRSQLLAQEDILERVNGE